MKTTYRLFKSPHGDVVRVRMGFSWQAFFVGSMKAIIRRTWLLGGVAVLFYMTWLWFGNAPTTTSRVSAFTVVLLCFYAVYMVFCGVNGSRWLSDSLRRRGFTLIGEERR